MSTYTTSAISPQSEPPLPALLQGRKILFVIDEMAAITAGGTERQLLQLAQLAKVAGLIPEIMVLRNTRWLTDEIAGCPVHHCDLNRIFSPHGIREVFMIRRWMREQKFDLMQTFFADANLLGPILGKLAGVPIILTSRRNLNYAMTPARLIAQRLVNPMTTEIIANCEAVRQAVLRSEKPKLKQVAVIYNGIDLDSFTPCSTTRQLIRAELGVSPNEVLIGCISAVRPVKGVRHLVSAAQPVLRKIPLARFCVVGDGEELHSLQQITNADPLLRERFTWVGAREDVRPFLRAFDIAVLPSLSEGFSNSILEYMAMGLPVVATDVGGNREALCDGAGILVPPGDAGRMAEVLEFVLSNSAARLKMGSIAAEKVQQWDIKVAFQNNANFYALHLQENTPPIP